MTLSALIAQYGLAAVFAGAVLEGETVLLLAGYAAHRGYLDFPAVVAVAGDQFWFWLGRRHGARLIACRPRLADRVARALRLIERHPRASILAMRFVWGLRSALPLALGMSRVRATQFLALNVASALLWAPLVAALGYAFGAALAAHPHLLERYELAGMVLVAALALLARVLHRRAQHNGDPR